MKETNTSQQREAIKKEFDKMCGHPEYTEVITATKQEVLDFFLSLRQKELQEIREMVQKRMMNPPPYPIEDENNPQLKAMQDGARMGDTQALTDILSTLTDETPNPSPQKAIKI